MKTGQIRIMRRPIRVVLLAVEYNVPADALLDDQGRPILDAQGHYIRISIPLDVPQTALLDDAGNPVLDDAGNYILAP
ncbi:hypothetical protein [Roseicella sp. DB1501]|uniref:hypothetical protein n=1 Tax=Roseicella sp. DB1501 TaxID=2730925 RepID=UPI001490CF50|nr:hypothetical protein [Roseicella sp. DB1501]